MHTSGTLHAMNEDRAMDPRALRTGRDLRFRRVAEVLAQQIRRDSFAHVGRLPPERSLSARFGVSRATVRRALEALEHEGLVIHAPRLGWLVRGRGLEEPHDELLSFTALAAIRGLGAGATVLLARTREATIEEAEELEVAPGAPVLEISRLRDLDGIPVAIDHSIVPAARAPSLLARDWSTASLYEAMAEGGCAPVRAEYVVFADGASPEEARHLGLPPGGPVLRADQRSFDAAGRPVQLSRIAYRGDRYRFRARLVRRTRTPLGTG